MNIFDKSYSPSKCQWRDGYFSRSIIVNVSDGSDAFTKVTGRHTFPSHTLILRVCRAQQPAALFSLVVFHYSSLVFPWYFVLFRVARSLPEKLALALRGQNMAGTSAAL